MATTLCWVCILKSQLATRLTEEHDDERKKEMTNELTFENICRVDVLQSELASVLTRLNNDRADFSEFTM